MARSNERVLIKGGHIWNSDSDFRGDILIEGKTIRAIGKHLQEEFSCDTVIDAADLYVFPGGIDVHTHMELPFMGTNASDDFETGTFAGIMGGTTSIIDFAIQEQGSTLNSCINQWHEKAMGKAVADYSFHCAVTDLNEKTAKEIPGIIENGITSFKSFMSYKGALMIDDRQMLELMGTVREHGGMVTVHAENGDMVDHLVNKFLSEGKIAPKYHALAHTAMAEAEACGRAMDLSRLMDCPLYIVHTSCEEAMKRVKINALRHQRVYVETCIQYLTLDNSKYEQEGFEGAKYVLSPPLREKSDCEALWHDLAHGHIHTVATDHCPFNYQGQKDLGKDSFAKIPNGLPAVEHRFELLFSEGVVKNRISPNRFVEVTSTHPARIFGMKNKGSLTVGKDADIVLLDPKQKHTIGKETHHQRVDYSAFEGFDVQGKVVGVFSKGDHVVRDSNAYQMKKGRGEFQKRASHTPL